MPAVYSARNVLDRFPLRLEAVSGKKGRDAPLGTTTTTGKVKLTHTGMI